MKKTERVTTLTSETGISNKPSPPDGGRPADSRSILRHAGFTLMEITIVVFILSIVLAFVLPNLSPKESSLRDEARRMASIIRYLNETAALKKNTLDLVFDLDKGIVKWTSPAGSRTEEFDLLRSVEMPSRGRVIEGELIVFFGPQGLGEHLWVHLGNDDHTLTVTFNPISGRASVTRDSG